MNKIIIQLIKITNNDAPYGFIKVKLVSKIYTYIDRLFLLYIYISYIQLNITSVLLFLSY